MIYHDAQRLNAAIIAAINIADEIGNDVAEVTDLLHDARRSLYTLDVPVTGGCQCSSVMDIEDLIPELIKKTIAAQEAKVETVRTLIRRGLPIPADLDDIVNLLCVTCGRDLDGYMNVQGICHSCANNNA